MGAALLLVLLRLVTLEVRKVKLKSCCIRIISCVLAPTEDSSVIRVQWACTQRERRSPSMAAWRGRRPRLRFCHWRRSRLLWVRNGVFGS